MRGPALAILISIIVLSGCAVNPDVAGARAAVGKELIYAYGCGSCHSIPGIPDAMGTAGPPLQRFASRSYIAGSFRNTRENLFLWIKNPPRMKPGNAMPDLGASDEQIRHIVAYLYTLR